MFQKPACRLTSKYERKHQYLSNPGFTKNIFLIKNVLKSYVLKPTWLFNKATWEKEANTPSTTIFVTTEKHENKMVIHEIGMGF